MSQQAAAMHSATNATHDPLRPNYKWVPIGYHGRASSTGVSGQRIHRPQGQTLAANASAPELGPSQRLDYELELGWVIGHGNDMGMPIAMGAAEQHLFGVALFNDWSARDIQAGNTSRGDRSCPRTSPARWRRGS